MKALLGSFRMNGIYLPQHGHMVVQASKSIIVKGGNQQGLSIFLTHCSIHYLLFKLASKLPWWSFILLHAVQANLQVEWSELELFSENIKEYWPADITPVTVGCLHAQSFC